MSHFLIRVGWLWLLLLPVGSLTAQSFKAYEKAGDKAAAAKDYNAAMHHYAQALGIRPEHAGLCYKYAGIAQRFHAYEAARNYYLKVTEHAEAKAFPLALFQLGMVEKSLGNYAEAKKQFTQYISLYGKGDTAQRSAAEDQIKQLEWAEQVYAMPERMEMTRLGKNVNTAYSEFGPLPRGDTLYYSSLRFDNAKDKHQPKRMVSKVLSSMRSGPGRPLRDAFNADTRHTAHLAISELNRRIYFTRCDYVNATEIRCALYYREPDRRGRWRGADLRLPDFINLEKFTTTHPAIGYDSIMQKELLFFVSDRPGGTGGLDIWQSVVLEKGAFGTPEPLGAINTASDDITPFFHTPTQTLYFSTEGRFSLGGFDIYSSMKSRDWSKPAHAGVPLNSSYNDIYPTILPNGQSGYLSSNRPGSLYLDAANKSCCNDIYQFRILPPETESPQTTDSIAPASTTLPSPYPLLPAGERIPETLEEFLPLALYFDNDEPDKRTRRTATTQTYGATFEKYFRHKAEYVQQYGGTLQGEEREDAQERMESFFEDNIRRGHDFLLRFSEILLTRLEANDQVEIFIKGFTSPRAQSDYNLSLGSRRISSVRNHFDNWQNGVFLPYLKSGQLKVSERSFGEATASKEVSDALDDLRGSVYSIGAMRERRVEIVEVKRKEN